MKRTIKRTEISVETIEITTIRRARPEGVEEAGLRRDTAGTTRISPSAALEQTTEWEIEDNRK